MQGKFRDDQFPIGNKVMIVEDESIIALKLKQDLESLNYEVVALCHSADSVLSVIPETDVDIVLMDIRLKGDLNGIQLAKKIQEFKEYPVLFISAFDEDDMIAQARELFPLGYIQKPFQRGDIKIALRIGIYKYVMDKKLKSSENKYRNLSEKLEKIVETRTEQLNMTNLELITSKNSLEDIISNFYHEIQQPLRLISNYFKILTDEVNFENSEVNTETKRILDVNIDLANSIVAQFKTYSNLLNTPADHTEIDIAEFVNQIREKHANIEIEIIKKFENTDGTRYVMGDRNQLIMLFEIIFQSFSIELETGAITSSFVVCASMGEKSINIDISEKNAETESGSLIQNDSIGELGMAKKFQMIICQKIIELHKGKFKTNTDGIYQSFLFSIPFLKN